MKKTYIALANNPGGAYQADNRLCGSFCLRRIAEDYRVGIVVVYTLQIAGNSSNAEGVVIPFERTVTLPEKANPKGPGDILVIGKFLGQTSSTIVANMIADNLGSRGCRVHTYDCTQVNVSGEATHSGNSRPYFSNVKTIIVACAPQTSVAAIDDFQRICPEYAEVVRNSRRAMCLSWETPDVPPEWVPLLGAFDEVWVPSNFVKDAALRSFPPHSGTEVVLVPHTVPPLDHINGNRAEFGLPADKTIVMTNFSFRSGMRRKNPLATVEAFRQAMDMRSRKDDAILVIKTSFSHTAPKSLALLKERIKDDPRIVLIDELYSPDKVHRLTKCADVVMSLAGAEGFGLYPAEAMRLGRPVIATNYGGHKDYIDADFAVPVRRIAQATPASDPDGMWTGHVLAEPNTHIAAAHLKRLLDSPLLRMQAGENAHSLARHRLGIQSFVKNIPDLVLSSGGVLPAAKRLAFKAAVALFPRTKDQGHGHGHSHPFRRVGQFGAVVEAEVSAKALASS